MENPETVASVATLLGTIIWPLIVLVLGLVFLFAFRSEIKVFINKVKSVGKGGVSIDTGLTPQVREEKTFDLLPHIEIEKSVLLEEVETIIVNDLIKRELDYESDTTKILVRNYAVAIINYEHEQAYGLIYGSQIHVLKVLNQWTGVGQPETALQAYFSEIKLKYPESYSAVSLDEYLQFLKARNLITIKNNNYHITDKGQDFLVWLAKNGKNEQRDF